MEIIIREDKTTTLLSASEKVLQESSIEAPLLREILRLIKENHV